MKEKSTGAKRRKYGVNHSAYYSWKEQKQSIAEEKKNKQRKVSSAFLKIIGWQLDDNLKEALVITAFKKALKNRNAVAGLMIHSDRSGQYTGNKFRKPVYSKKLLQSMSQYMGLSKQTNSNIPNTSKN